MRGTKLLWFSTFGNNTLSVFSNSFY